MKEFFLGTLAGAFLITPVALIGLDLWAAVYRAIHYGWGAW